MKTNEKISSEEKIKQAIEDLTQRLEAFSKDRNFDPQMKTIFTKNALIGAIKLILTSHKIDVDDAIDTLAYYFKR